MDIYEALSGLLTASCPDATGGIYHIMFDFNARTKEYVGNTPAITYEFSSAKEMNTHQGRIGVQKVQIDFNLWGELEKIEVIAGEIRAALNGKRASQGGFTFSLAENMKQDIFEPNLGQKRILLRYKGVVIGS